MLYAFESSSLLFDLLFSKNCKRFFAPPTCSLNLFFLLDSGLLFYFFGGDRFSLLFKLPLLFKFYLEYRTEWRPSLKSIVCISSSVLLAEYGLFNLFFLGEASIALFFLTISSLIGNNFLHLLHLLGIL